MSTIETQTDAETMRDSLLAQLGDRMTSLQRFDSYYRGEHRLLFATAKFRETFGTLFSSFADNWCDLVVDASVERLNVQGFRFGTDDADAEAWDIWQQNDLDAESELAHTEAVKLGCAYALVGPDDGGEPSIQIESPTQAIVCVDPAQGRKRLAGLRYWIDEYGVEQCVLYTPTDVLWWTKQGEQKSWQLDDLATGGNVLDVVPLIPHANMPTLNERQGRSDVERVIPLQDAVNKQCADMIVASEYAAYPQRWVTGVEIPKYPEGHPSAGQPLPSITSFLSGADRVMAVEEQTAKFGNFQVSDLSIYTKAIEMFV